MKHENLVLSNELIKFNLQPVKILKVDISSVSPSFVIVSMRQIL